MKPLCIMPWIYMEIFPDGTVTPCCATGHHPLGNIQDNSIEEIWNSPNINKFRLDMLKDSLPNSCFACIITEKLGGNSLREKYNTVFENSFHNISDITNSDGSLKEVKFKGWDFKVSNKCNFKCRMCLPVLSSSINEENKSLGLEGYDTILNHSPSLNIEKFVNTYIDDLELIEFAGGETLLMDEQYELLKLLIDRKKTDIALRYNTNMSVLKYKNHHILDYWRQWNPDKLRVVASIDEIGERAELIRKGTRWKTVEDNLKTLSKEKFNTDTNITFTSMNVFRIPQILDHLIEIGHINERFNFSNFEVNMETGKFSVTALTNKYRSKIKNDIEEYIKNYKLKYNVDIGYKFDQVLNTLKLPHNINKSRLLIENILEMDKIRNEKTFDIIPELVGNII